MSIYPDWIGIEVTTGVTTLVEGYAVTLDDENFVVEIEPDYLVVLEDGKTAERRSIKIGSQNPKFYELLEGLSAGEKVITSGYDLFGDNERLVLN